MDIKAVEYVIAIAQAKTISGAAKNLYISQPALSQYLQRIEQELGTPIFNRRGSHLDLTPTGEVLVQKGRALLNMRQDMLEQINGLADKNKKTIRFGISPFYSKYYLPPLMLYYREHYPQTRFEIVEKISVELEKAVLEGSLEVCFAPAYPIVPGLHYEMIHMEEIMIAVPKDHPVNQYATPSYGTPYMEMEHLKNLPFVALEPEQKFAQMSQHIFQHFNIVPNVIYETLNWDTVHALVANGIGVGLLPAMLREMYLSMKRPNYYRIPGYDATRPYAAIYPKGKRLSQEQNTLIETFKNILAAFSAEIG